MSPAGNPIAIMFSVIYVMSKSKPPSWKKKGYERGQQHILAKKL